MFLTTLGGLSLPLNSGTSGHLAPGKPLAVVAYLAASPGRTATRASLVSLLWADLEPEAAKHALRQTIWYLKKKTGTDLLVADGDALRLTADLTVDRDELLAASRAGNHAQVVALYAGPFIPNFAAPGGGSFEEWAALERRRLLEVFRHSATAATATLLSAGKGREAIALARRLRDQDIYEEGSWRLLIETCIAAGDALAARAESEALAHLAEQEQMELEPATRAVLRAVRNPGAGPSPSAEDGRSLAPSLVGRESTFAAILTAWESARKGRPQRLHLTARAGLGKSRLIRETASRLRGMRAKVVTVGGSLGTREVAFAAAGDLAAALASLPGRSGIAPESAATLVELNPTISTWFERAPRAATRDDPMRARTAAVRELLSAVAYENPVAILVDDLHWWDDASVALLAAAMDTLGDARILLVTAGRPEARRIPLVAAPSTHHLTIDPLSVEHVEELVLSIAALPSTPWAQAFPGDLWRASRGSPLLVLEMLQLLEERGLITRTDGGWHSDAPAALGAELQQGDVLRARIADLERDDRSLLTLVAVARTPVSATVLAHATQRRRDDTATRLSAMESRGLLVREEEEWRVSHDEIADEALRLAPVDAMPRAAAQLGTAIFTASPFSEGTARRAAQLLRNGGDPETRADLFRTFARHRFAMGDRRSVHHLAADLLGPTALPSEVAELVRRAPITWRVGLVSGARQAAAALALFSTVAFGALLTRERGAPAPADAVLGLAFADSLGRVRFERVDLRQSNWSPRDSLETVPWQAPAITIPSGNGLNVDYHAATRTLVTAQPVADSGVIDLFVYQPGQPPRRLFPYPRDDGGVKISPDGRLVAFSTARWDSLAHYDIAIGGLESTVPIQLTSGPATDGEPRWSPNGSRIAFARANWGRAPSEVCVLTVATRAVECRAAVSVGAEDTPMGWIDPDRLVVSEFVGLRRNISVIQWSTGERVPVFDGVASTAVLSPDGNWLFCTCASAADGQLTPSVLPLAAPNLARPIARRDARPGSFLAAFWIESGESIPATGISIDSQVVLAPEAPIQLRAAIRDSRGNPLQTFGRIRWSVMDTAAATIDSLTGMIRARATASQVTVVALVGQNMADTTTFTVNRANDREVFSESWQHRLDQWIPFGAPVPTIGRSLRGAWSLLNNGDGSFESGVLSRQAMATGQGVAVDLVAETPITMLQWQLVRASLRSRPNLQQYEQGAGVNPIPRPDPESELCGFGYPQEGKSSGLQPLVTVQARVATARFRFEGLDSGRPWKVRIQLFPDGRCGIAINGTPIGIVDGGRVPDATVHLTLNGNSYATRIAVGPLTARLGVPTDIDWTRAPVAR